VVPAAFLGQAKPKVWLPVRGDVEVITPMIRSAQALDVPAMVLSTCSIFRARRFIATNPIQRQPLVLPPNFRDVTAERAGAVVVIVGGDGCGGRERSQDDRRRIDRPRIAPGRSWARRSD
jgi:hypothetical protein